MLVECASHGEDMGGGCLFGVDIVAVNWSLLGFKS